MSTALNHIGIDVETCEKNKLIRALGRLKSTVSVVSGGAYREDRNYSQVHLVTTRTEAEVDAWATRNNSVSFIGTFPMQAS